MALYFELWVAVLAGNTPLTLACVLLALSIAVSSSVVLVADTEPRNNYDRVFYFFIDGKNVVDKYLHKMHLNINRKTYSSCQSYIYSP